MRPEIKEYNYDWLMGGVLQAGSRVPDGTTKETELTYRYIPYYKGVLKSFIDTGDVGIQVLKLFDKYYKNILTAHEQQKNPVSSFFLKNTCLWKISKLDVIIYPYSS